ncbi:hypothetical protein EDB86DRAFT_2834921 [Lactarius hatsudake]|nr:hypothetical protein EDB86DRAFT_2834921 [Lactarius hatsudake]
MPCKPITTTQLQQDHSLMQAVSNEDNGEVMSWRLQQYGLVTKGQDGQQGSNDDNVMAAVMLPCCHHQPCTSASDSSTYRPTFNGARESVLCQHPHFRRASSLELAQVYIAHQVQATKIHKICTLFTGMCIKLPFQYATLKRGVQDAHWAHVWASWTPLFSVAYWNAQAHWAVVRCLGWRPRHHYMHKAHQAVERLSGVLDAITCTRHTGPWRGWGVWGRPGRLLSSVTLEFGLIWMSMQARMHKTLLGLVEWYFIGVLDAIICTSMLCAVIYMRSAWHAHTVAS